MRNNKGFTLVELLVVIAIIAILAAVISPSAFTVMDKGKASTFYADADAIKKAMLVYYADTSNYPKYRLYGENKSNFTWITTAFLITGNFDNPPSGVSVINYGAPVPGGNGTFAERPRSGCWNGPYLERWKDKTPFGGYYYLFDYNPLVYTGVNFQTFMRGATGVYRSDENGQRLVSPGGVGANLWDDFNGARVVVFEIGFGPDRSSRDKAVKILKQYGNSDQIYQQDITMGGVLTHNLMVPVLVE